MKRFKLARICFVMVFVITIVFGSASALMSEEKKPDSHAKQEMMKRNAALTSPGENHKHLEYFVGDWESEVKVFRPGAAPDIHKQTLSVRPFHGGRFNKAEIKGVAMGNPYEVWVFTGYDNAKKQFFTIQLSSMNTGYTLSNGTINADGKGRVENGEYFDPGSGKTYKLEIITTLFDNDNYKYEVFLLPPNGGKMKITEIVYKRIKK